MHRRIASSAGTRPPRRDRRSARAIRLLFGLLCGALLLTGCGGGSGTPDSNPGTVALRNETDQGMAPLVVEQFFLAPVGSSAGDNRLKTDLQPGGVVIIGLFPAGRYNATAVLEGGFNVNWMDEEIVAGQPKNFTIP